MAKKKLWFKAKKYGYGWYPVSKEGWAVVSLFIIAITILAVIGGVLLFIGTPIFIIILFIISSRRGEKASWRWGNKK